jgi:hypothetical protein
MGFDDEGFPLFYCLGNLNSNVVPMLPCAKEIHTTFSLWPCRRHYFMTMWRHKRRLLSATNLILRNVHLDPVHRPILAGVTVDTLPVQGDECLDRLGCCERI